MSGRFIALIAVIAAFGALTALALMDVGYLGIFLSSFRDVAGTQIFFDLVIMGVLVCIWMYNDARERGAVVWPFILMTFALGSFGPLFYLALREWNAARRPAAA